MRILHTSDWHIGRVLYTRHRYDEFSIFFEWLLQTLQQQKIEVLLIAGDIFDTSTPSNRAQTLYYQLLGKIAQTGCRHVVIVSGNHDSPSFLNAPKALLQMLNVWVIGEADIAEEVLVLDNQQGEPALIVCAVPYLRDKDIRQVEAGETIADKERKLVEGIQQHYAQIGEIAYQKQQALGGKLPILATGHLFAAGGKTEDDDGVRDLYVGSLAHVTADIFPSCFDYIALGHLHVPQMVNNREHIRYSGSPLAMGFGEANQQKVMYLLEFLPERQISEIKIPAFQAMARIKGDWANIEQQILKLKQTSSNSVWLEICYEGNEIKSDLREALNQLTENSPLEILRIKNNRIMEHSLAPILHETLDDLDTYQVFNRCLDAHQIPHEQREVLLQSYREIVIALAI